MCSVQWHRVADASLKSQQCSAKDYCGNGEVDDESLPKQAARTINHVSCSIKNMIRLASGSQLDQLLEFDRSDPPATLGRSRFYRDGR